jgi:hypothetical protein
MRLVLPTLLLWLSMTACHAANATQEAERRLHEDAASRIASGRLESLLADADRYLKTQDRIPDGRWKLALLLGGMRRGFERAVHVPEDWTSFERQLRALAAAHPDSPNAWLFVAVLVDSHAWAARGHGTADAIKSMGFDAFRRYNEQGRAVLDEHPVRANPAWYALRLRFGGSLGESPEQLERLFAEAIQREPGYQQTWFSRLTYLEPQWGGSTGEVVRLANRAARTASPTEGSGMMARVLFLAYSAGVSDALTDPGVDWATLKASMDDVLRRYPDDWNAQPFFFEACSRSDKAEAQHLLAFVKEPPIGEAINDNDDAFKACVDWANGKLPAFRLHDDRGGVQTVR